MLSVTHAGSATSVRSHAFSIPGWGIPVSQQVNHVSRWTLMVEQGKRQRQGSLGCSGIQKARGECINLSE